MHNLQRLGLWEELSNPNFKLAESREFKLVILSNLENLNAEMIESGLEQSQRLEKLNAIAKKQYITLQDSSSIKKIEALDNTNKKRLNS